MGASTTISSGQTGPCSNSGAVTDLNITAAGSISAGSSGVANTGTITTLINSGSVSGTQYGVTNTSTITTLTNTATISGGVAGINNTGTISTFNNSQGKSSSALSYTGALPANYNVIINSTANFGQLAVNAVTGTMAFNIYGNTGTTLVNGVPTSTVAAGTYADVLQGFSTLTGFVTGATGTFGSLTYSLVADGSNSGWWNLVFATPAPPPSPAPTPPAETNIVPGSAVGLSSVGVTSYPVFNGGALTLVAGDSSSQPFTILSAGGTITSPSSGSAQLSGAFSGPGGLTVNGPGTLVLTGTNTYSGGTTVASGTLQGNTNSLQGNIVNNSTVVFDQGFTGTYSSQMSGHGSLTMQNAGTLIMTGANSYSGGTTVLSGTVSIAGGSPLGTGVVNVGPGATLMGSGTIGGALTVAGTLKPGNSPGYLAVTAPVSFNSGSTYQQDIAGRVQASSTTPTGSTGYYSFMNVTGAGVTINSGATLNPQLQNLFSPSEAGYGSASYVPVPGDKFRILTADGGITGKFSTLLQPVGLASGTQFITFYNYNGSNSLDLAVIPSSFNTAVSASGNKNAQSVGSALDKMVAANQSGTSSAAQDQLLYGASGQSLASLPTYTQGLAGEIYGATLAVVPQTTQRLQQAVLTRLGDALFVPMRGATAATSATNSAISATNPGGQPTASMSSNPGVNPYAASFSNGTAWGEVAYQYGNRSSDSNAGGWTSNLVQAVVGADVYSAGGIKAGGGVSLSNTNVSASQGSGTVQQGSLFLYGKLPVQQFVVDAVASYGFNSTDNTRRDVTGITNGFRAKGIQGNDALVSLGLNLPIELEQATLSPYARVTWQQVTQNGFNEGSAASALTVNSYNGNGARGVIGLAAGSRATNPLKETYTYRANVGVGVDSTTLLSPMLNASLVGTSTQINTPSPGAAFVQVGLFGTANLADNAYAYMGVTTEVRSGQTLVGGNVGVMMQF